MKKYILGFLFLSACSTTKLHRNEEIALTPEKTTGILWNIEFHTDSNIGSKGCIFTLTNKTMEKNYDITAYPGKNTFLLEAAAGTYVLSNIHCNRITLRTYINWIDGAVVEEQKITFIPAIRVELKGLTFIGSLVPKDENFALARNTLKLLPKSMWNDVISLNGQPASQSMKH